MNSTVKTTVFWLVIVISAYLLWHVVKSGQNEQTVPEISYSEFLSQVESGNVSRVTISKSQVTGKYRDNRFFRVTAPTGQEGMFQTLHQKNVEIWIRGLADMAVESGAAHSPSCTVVFHDSAAESETNSNANHASNFDLLPQPRSIFSLTNSSTLLNAMSTKIG